MRKPKIWKVRVLRKVEDWVNVEAVTAAQAELAAGEMLNIVHVFGNSAIMAVPKGAEVVRIGVDDTDD